MPVNTAPILATPFPDQILPGGVSSSIIVPVSTFFDPDPNDQLAYTAVQLAGILGSHGVKLVPDVSVSGSGEGGGSHSALAGALMGRMVGSLTVAAPKPVTPVVKNGHQ